MGLALDLAPVWLGYSQEGKHHMKSPSISLIRYCSFAWMGSSKPNKSQPWINFDDGPGYLLICILFPFRSLLRSLWMRWYGYLPWWKLCCTLSFRVGTGRSSVKPQCVIHCRWLNRFLLLVTPARFCWAKFSSYISCSISFTTTHPVHPEGFQPLLYTFRVSFCTFGAEDGA